MKGGIYNMFGKRKNTKNDLPVLEDKPDLVVEKETVGMPGFTVDPEPTPAPAPAPAPAPVAAPAPAPVAAPAPAPPIKEQYQIVEVGMSVTEGIYVYKIVTNKYLGELGGVYEA